jgi:hypothetical protein
MNHLWFILRLYPGRAARETTRSRSRVSRPLGLDLNCRRSGYEAEIVTTLSRSSVTWQHCNIKKYTQTQLNNSIEHSRSSKANSQSASQVIPRLLWNPMFHYRVHIYTHIRGKERHNSIRASHCRQSTNFPNCPRSCSAILRRVLLKRL